MNNDAIEEMFEPLGPVTVRRMFGGKGIYHQGMIIALELSDGELLLKADATSAAEFRAAGARQWTYESKKGKAAAMPYWTIPDEALDDPDILQKWLRLAYEAALRAQSPT
ncbi:TfoX domain protein [Pseudorhizobium banfieldiae]|uniref:TfoX domain protein n=1 Tax=Pseudorhizobium banfieldiae TaxID=1125847 RepID=L0NFC9_9HYPH|nr:TfoX/Sxy family protein [Pseudorhizobium banfieldiae]CAD6609749.1 competence protein TfoX [arsenite-oxidising bacterium NT-25]CCF19589.1 TfoX domain protein [Pseudorhizobium banfieldiae]